LNELKNTNGKLSQLPFFQGVKEWMLCEMIINLASDNTRNLPALELTTGVEPKQLFQHIKQ